jgi:hypothetical protein
VVKDASNRPLGALKMKLRVCVTTVITVLSKYTQRQKRKRCGVCPVKDEDFTYLPTLYFSR